MYVEISSVYTDYYQRNMFLKFGSGYIEGAAYCCFNYDIKQCDITYSSQHCSIAIIIYV